MVYANDKYVYANVHMLSMSLPYCFHKINTFPDVIVQDSFTIFQTYNFISCDISCDNGHIPLHCPRKRNKIEIKLKLKIKENKENEKKIKIY